MKMKFLRFRAAVFFACIFIFLANSSFAGFRDDHLIAWINRGAGNDDLKMTRKIESFANSGRMDAACKINWTNNDSIVYINSRLPGVTNDLLRKSFFEKDTSALTELSRALRSFRDAESNVNQGLDGVVLYSGAPFFRMMSFTVGKRKIKIHPTKIGAWSKQKEIEDAFCELLPSIARAP